MSFNTALSGLNAAQSDMGVTSNNIANVNTTGFKQSRAEFGDIFANSAFGRNAKTAIGSGVLLNRTAQQFSQGNLEFTSNILDLAVAGDGFFVTSPNLTSQERVYTRAGAFGVNADGFIVNGGGQFLQVFPVNQDGTVTTTSISGTVPLQIPSTAGTPTATQNVGFNINLSANAPLIDTVGHPFNPTDTQSYSASTSITIYDSLGNSHIGTTYYVKTAANTWDSYLYVDGANVDLDTAGAGTSFPLVFDAAGVLQPPSSTTSAAVNYTGGAAPATLNIDYANSTQLSGSTGNGSYITVNSLSQDGYSTGRLSGIEISETGVVRANFTNGQTVALGKVALARFQNPQGLNQLGNTSWAETLDSGTALPGEAGTLSFGLIRSGALETSNVDLTAELVNLITAQRNFQANARAIETNNTLTQTIINIR